MKSKWKKNLVSYNLWEGHHCCLVAECCGFHSWVGKQCDQVEPVKQVNPKVKIKLKFEFGGLNLFCCLYSKNSADWWGKTWSINTLFAYARTCGSLNVSKALNWPSLCAWYYNMHHRQQEVQRQAATFLTLQKFTACGRSADNSTTRQNRPMATSHLTQQTLAAFFDLGPWLCPPKFCSFSVLLSVLAWAGSTASFYAILT